MSDPNARPDTRIVGKATVDPSVEPRMLRVIDTIRFDETTLQSSPDLMARLGLGLLVILDPAQV